MRVPLLLISYPDRQELQSEHTKDRVKTLSFRKAERGDQFVLKTCTLDSRIVDLKAPIS